MAYQLFLDFQTGSGFVEYTTSLYYPKGAMSTPVLRYPKLHTGLKCASNALKFSLKDPALIKQIAIASNRILVKVKKDGADYFTGILKRNNQIRSNTIRLDVSSFEANDKWYYIGDAYTTLPICYQGYTVSNPSNKSTSLLHQLLYLAGFVDAELNLPTISKTVTIFTLESGEKLKEPIETILSEAGYVSNIDVSGVVQLVNLFPGTITPSKTISPSNKNILGGYDFTGVEASIEGVDVIFKEPKQLTNVKLFEDTTGATGALACSIPVLDGAYYPSNASATTDAYAEYKIQDYTLISAYNVGSISYSNTGNITKLQDVAGYKKHKIKFTSSGGGVLTSLSITGSAYVEGDQKTYSKDNVLNSIKREKITLKYLLDSTTAYTLAQCRASWYLNSKNNVSFLTNDTTISIGDYLTFNDTVNGINFTVRVVEANDTSTPNTKFLVCEGVSAVTITASSPTDTTVSTTSPLPIQVGYVVDGTMAYRNDLPPTNNITGLSIVSDANSDGSVNFNFSWSYTQGSVKADGFLIYYKSGTSAPGAINYVTDSCMFVPASSSGTSYTYTLPAMAVRFGGAGSLVRHYRFGVVAVATRVSGTIPHQAGVVEVTDVINKDTNPYSTPGSTWVDAQFAPAISNVEGNVSFNIEGQSLVWRAADTGLEVGRVGADSVDGYTKIDRLKTKIKYNGSWTYGTWGTATTIASGTQTSGWMRETTLSDGRVMVVFPNSDNTAMMSIIRATNGTWGSITTIFTESISPYFFCICTLNDGRVLLVYISYTYGAASERIMDTNGVWSERTSVPKTIQDMVVLSDGRVVGVAYSSGAIYELIRSTSGVWQNTATIYSGGTYYSDYSLALMPDGSIFLICDVTNDGLYQIIRSPSGTWGAPSCVAGSMYVRAGYGTRTLVNPDGSLIVIYTDGSIAGSYLISRSSSGVWSSNSTAFISVLIAPCHGSLFVTPTGTLECMYQSTNLLVRPNSASYGSIPYKTDYAYVGAGITEMGQNTNGNYIKFSDGTLECWGNTATITISTAWGTGLYYSNVSITFPSAFIATPVASWNTNSASSNMSFNGCNGSVSTTGITNMTAISSSSGPTAVISWRAVGRYK